ncbi:hypothetical protein Syun_024672 [Stephania yunnanensis]|uniref:Uncharacterized protein n=1 Tax=Stephania yunnanensis TaxID=152371 RepID=A0AAP0I4V9_9MAGN
MGSLKLQRGRGDADIPNIGESCGKLMRIWRVGERGWDTILVLGDDDKGWAMFLNGLVDEEESVTDHFAKGRAGRIDPEPFPPLRWEMREEEECHSSQWGEGREGGEYHKPSRPPSMRSEQGDTWNLIESRLAKELRHNITLTTTGEDRAILECQSLEEKIKLLNDGGRMCGELVASKTEGGRVARDRGGSRVVSDQTWGSTEKGKEVDTWRQGTSLGQREDDPPDIHATTGDECRKEDIALYVGDSFIQIVEEETGRRAGKEVAMTEVEGPSTASELGIRCHLCVEDGTRQKSALSTRHKNDDEYLEIRGANWAEMGGERGQALCLLCVTEEGLKEGLITEAYIVELEQEVAGL